VNDPPLGRIFRNAASWPRESYLGIDLPNFKVTMRFYFSAVRYFGKQNTPLNLLSTKTMLVTAIELILVFGSSVELIWLR
jgi:hypothetical protein